MNLDQYGLPVQSNGDASDQLHRVGMIATALKLQNVPDGHFAKALFSVLQVRDGIFRRSTSHFEDDVSCDQLVPVLAFFVSSRNLDQIGKMWRAMMARCGFAQNIVDGLNGDHVTRKLPDFMLFRTLPLFARASPWLYPITVIADLYLIVLAIGDWIYLRTQPDPADVNNTLVTLFVCLKIMPTPISKLTFFVWSKLEPSAITRMKRYHRKQSGGNPEIADIWGINLKYHFNKVERLK